MDLLLVRALARRDLLCDCLDRDVDAQHHVVEVDQLHLQVLKVLALLRLAQLVGRMMQVLLLLLQLLLQAGELRLGLLALGLDDFEALGEGLDEGLRSSMVDNVLDKCSKHKHETPCGRRVREETVVALCDSMTDAHGPSQTPVTRVPVTDKCDRIAPCGSSRSIPAPWQGHSH